MPGKAAEWRQDLDSHRINSLSEMFSKPKPVIAMVHLPPLPAHSDIPVIRCRKSSILP